MSIRFSFQSAALICLVVAAPVFTVNRLADALSGFDDYQGTTQTAVRPAQTAGAPATEPAPTPVAFEAAADYEVVVTSTGRPA
jgi:hypothetical protein